MLTRTFTNYQKITELTTEIEAGRNVFDGEGVSYKGKLIGMEDLSIDRDEKTCLDSIFKLKNIVRVRGEHKQKIQIYLSLDGVKIVDELTRIELAYHEIQRISFVIMDPQDIRAFGYIYNTSDERHQFWAIKTERPAQFVVFAFKDLFDEVYKHKLSSNDGNGEINQVTSTLPSIEEVTAPIQTLPTEFPSVFPSQPTIQSPKSAPLTTQVPTTSLFDNVWGDNLSATISLPSQISQKQSTFDNDPWGFDKPVVSVKQSAPRITDSPTNAFILPPPPPSLSRRITTTQQPTPTVDTGDLFSVFNTTPSPFSVNNNGFTPSTEQTPSVSQEETNFLNSMPSGSSITSPTAATNSSDHFDLRSDFSSQSTTAKPTNELLFIS